MPDVKWMILTYEQDSFFFSWSSNGTCKTKFVSQFTCLQSHLYVKHKRWKYNK